MYKVDDDIPFPRSYRLLPELNPRQSVVMPGEYTRSIRAMASRARKKGRLYVTRKVMVHECGSGEGDPHYFETPVSGRCPECGGTTFGPAEPGLRVWRVE